MSRFLESICIEEGIVQRLAWHQRRVDATLKNFYGGGSIDLERIIGSRSKDNNRGIVKCRLTYDDRFSDMQFSPYTPKTVETLRLIENNEIDYAFKFTNRTDIEKAFGERDKCDDILIVRGGKITDSSIANIVFRGDTAWYTPRDPLLKGTMRQYLLDHYLLQEADIRVNDLASFSHFKLINAMLGFASAEREISNIKF